MYIRYPNSASDDINQLIRVLMERDEATPTGGVNISPYQQVSAATTISQTSTPYTYNLAVDTPTLENTNEVLWTLIRDLKESGIIK